MNNPLLAKVDALIKEAGLDKPKLVTEMYSPDSFGNAQAVYELSNLVLCFTRDRGNDIVALSSRVSPHNSYPFCNVSIMMGWQELDEIIDIEKPIEIKDAIKFISDDFEKLNEMFSAENLMETNLRINNVMKQRKMLR